MYIETSVCLLRLFYSDLNMTVVRKTARDQNGFSETEETRENVSNGLEED